MSDSTVPICVDFDGTLTPVDSLHESLLELVRQSPKSLLSLPAWIRKGKAYFKNEVAARTQINVATLPLHEALVQWLKTERSKGRRIILATAANEKIAANVVSHGELFDDFIASNATENLSGEAKRRALVSRFGEHGFDYVGNDSIDELVWKSARKAIVVGDDSIVTRAKGVAEVELVFHAPSVGIRVWLKAIRLHQWVKNVLVFLPALLAHKILVPESMIESLLAFLAFGLCASSVYVINDLLDLGSDRRHPRKRLRPFASGALSAKNGLVVAMLLLGSSIAISVAVNLWFCLVLAGYYVFTWAYTLRLKRAALVDVMTLAGLYTTRIIAGAAATQIQPSFWLLAFSVFIFLCLGIVKRFAELNDARQAGKTSSHGRGYSGDDLPLLMNLGISSGYCAIVVMALYINSPDSLMLYKHSKPLWLICPLMLYWVSRMWLLASRGQMDDDPVVFAVRDRISLLVLGCIGIVVFASI